MLINESGRPLAAEGLQPMGRFVNGLVALYTVALFNTERRHGKTILGSDFDLATVPHSDRRFSCSAHRRHLLFNPNDFSRTNNAPSLRIVPL